MKAALALLALTTAGALMLSGCADSPPTYDQVRAETNDVLRQVADLVPDPKEIVPNESFEPYSCGDNLTFGAGRGSFYTGQWEVYVDDSFDISSFIARFPDAVGDGWRAHDLGVPVNFAQIYMVRDSPRMSLGMSERTIDGRKAIDLLAISRCGTLSEDQRP
ncbi:MULTISPECIES: hypothetical protein [Microbacterium]|uniref:hypothetical protein n=1 Tax=Microbacterium TaxID=33882 RepID=UPI002786985B|nr:MULTISPECIES: hypothetical protein [Microbacterium]MDQ1076584.1 hypothetical protein [Microbacterium sp. SORGH_AS_0969]MDQ1116822.1 hypothetical protein [Microbacterium testaceum]